MGVRCERQLVRFDTEKTPTKHFSRNSIVPPCATASERVSGELDLIGLVANRWGFLFSIGSDYTQTGLEYQPTSPLDATLLVAGGVEVLGLFCKPHSTARPRDTSLKHTCGFEVFVDDGRERSGPAFRKVLKPRPPGKRRAMTSA